MNQIFEIILKFFITKNSQTNWMTILSLIQTNINNPFNATIELTLNKIIYDFKIKNKFIACSKKFVEKLVAMTNKNLKKNFEKNTFALSSKNFERDFFVNVKTKLMYDKKHKFFFWKKKTTKFISNFITNTNCRKIIIENCQISVVNCFW